MSTDQGRSSNGFVRTVASIVLITYSTLVVSPGVLAMQRAGEQERTRDQALAVERSDYGKALKRAKERLRVLADHPDELNRRPSREQRRVAKEALREWRAESREIIEQMRSEFTSTQALIERNNLPDVIRQRQAEAIAQFEAQTAAFNREMDEALSTTDAAAEKQKAEAALRRLDRNKLGRSHQEFNPNALPNGILKPDRTRTPKTTTEAFQAALLADNPTARLAQTTGFDFLQLPGANNPSYLEPSTEVVLTPDIQAKADELHRNPVEVYNWVRNNVHWQPTWGAIQDASHTLSSYRGNAFDIAGLTIALLRASGIPARYVHGTIDVPEDKFRNWAGGFENIEAAMDFASAGGIPLAAVTSGGRITKIRMEHVWVEAALDFNPSRGAKNRSADSWVALDPSFKQFELLAGLNPVEVSGLDAAQLTQGFVASGSVNESAGTATGLDPMILANAQRQGRDALETHVTQSLPDATVGDVLGGRRIIAAAAPVLAASLPNRVVAAGVKFANVPTSLQQRITFAFGKDIEGEPVDPQTFAWAQLNNRQVTLSFRPATQADTDALRAMLPDGEITDLSQLPTSIPAYLIRAVPELRLDGALLMSGSAMTLGTDLNFVFNPSFVGSGTKPFSYLVPAGSYLSVAVFAGSISPRAVATAKARITQTSAVLANQTPGAAAGLTRDDLLVPLFYSGLLEYYGHYVSLADVTGLKQGGRFSLASGLGTFGHEPRVDSFFGVPRRVHTGNAVMNIPIVNIVGHDSMDAAKKRVYVWTLGATSSALEHMVPEQTLSLPDQPVEAISAVKAIQKALVGGQSVYSLNSGNASTHLANIAAPAELRSELMAAVQNNKEVIIHSAPVAVPGWTGFGYMIMDPLTGEGAYRITGGANGGESDLVDQFAILGAGASGYVDGSIGKYADEPIMFSERLKYLKRLAQKFSFLGAVALIATLFQTATDDKLSGSQQLGKASLELLGFALGAYFMGLVPALMAALPFAAAIMITVVVSVAIAMLVMELQELLFTFRREERRRMRFA